MASELEITPQEIGEDEGAKVSDVTEVIHRGPAAIEPDGIGLGKKWGECLNATLEGIEQAKGHVMGGSLLSGFKIERHRAVGVFSKAT
jgi:hypothetical protein